MIPKYNVPSRMSVPRARNRPLCTYLNNMRPKIVLSNASKQDQVIARSVDLERYRLRLLRPLNIVDSLLMLCQ
ncbi:hypothetical protein PUNSTDRAFT_52508 [Punctularia strigosozonata HHB-11173 SS5]|uniref:uncharacterized protein n=1 Tax=Punctularia strigosozonata (strain HHB-11173) TaxID=741275 RepID=UPI0004416CAA|nr:uncharacterized protein PUNSTDRAFT_52508 [Punctularia strigosozonata HHB-11173 SS5]EIN09109.1 hypothetical protein PUNSTDRAFT_52508 [Punctularia strigosozonata HHB-11173 SS5]